MYLSILFYKEQLKEHGHDFGVYGKFGMMLKVYANFYLIFTQFHH